MMLAAVAPVVVMRAGPQRMAASWSAIMQPLACHAQHSEDGGFARIWLNLIERRISERAHAVIQSSV